MLFGPTNWIESQLSSFISALPYPFELIKEIRVSMVYLFQILFDYQIYFNALLYQEVEIAVNNNSLILFALRGFLFKSLKFLELIKQYLIFTVFFIIN